VHIYASRTGKNPVWQLDLGPITCARSQSLALTAESYRPQRDLGRVRPVTATPRRRAANTQARTGTTGQPARRLELAAPGPKEKSPAGFPAGPLNLKPGSDLLWHARRAHYHRRRAFSLPSSERDRVVPARYCRQANFLNRLRQGLRPAAANSNPVSFLSNAVVAFAMMMQSNSNAST
jgi:hypothetical protein